MDKIFSFLDKVAMNQGVALLFGAIAFASLLLCVCASVLSGRIAARHLVNGLCDSIVVASVSALVGFGFSKIVPSGSDVTLIYCISALVAALLAVLRYHYEKKKMVRAASSSSIRKSASSTASVRFAFSRLYGAAICFVAVAAYQVVRGQVTFCQPLFVVAVTVVSLMLHKLLRVRFWYWLALLAAVLFVMSAGSVWFVEANVVNIPLAAASAAVFATLFAAFVTLSITKE